MRKMNKFLIIGCSVLSVLTGCTKGRLSEERGTQQQILIFGNGTEPQDLDPHIVTGVPESHLLMALFEGLIGIDPHDLHPVPGVAGSWTVSPDQKVYLFKLRKNALWSNGDPVTAKDFVYSWRRILSPGLAGEYAYMLYYLENATAYNEGKLKDFSKVGVKALDPYTLEVRLTHPTPYFLAVLQHTSTYPVHQATVEKFGKMDERGTLWTRPGNIVSNGPFVLKKWELNKTIDVVKNPKYWDAQNVHLNGVNFLPIDNEAAEEKTFRSGDMHVTNTVPINKIGVYKSQNPGLLRIEPYLGTYFYRFNVTRKPFDNPLVRRAFAMSIDKKALVEEVTKGGQAPALAFTPPNTAGYYSRAAVPYDVATAQKLMSEAGYPNGQGFPAAEVLYNSAESHKVIAEALQQMWKKALNVNITLSNQDWKVYIDSTKTLNYSMSRAGWIGDYNDPTNFLDMWVTNGGNNQTGWSNQEYDALIAEAARTRDTNARYEVFQKAEKLLLTEMPVLPIYSYTRVYLISPDVKGWYSNILDVHPFKGIYLSNEKKITRQ